MRPTSLSSHPTAVTDANGIESDLRPRAVRIAVWALLFALSAGVIEMAAQLWPLDRLNDSAGAVTIRLGIYAFVLICIIFFARGRGWARLLLLVGIGVVGTLSLIIDPLLWLFAGPDFGAFFAALDGQLTAIVASRIAHIVAVMVAVTAMLRRSTRDHCTRHR